MRAEPGPTPKKASLLVPSPEGGTVPSDRRLISAAAIKPPANGSHALACSKKKEYPVASCWLAHRHHARDKAAKACSAMMTALIPDVAREASRQISDATSGMQK